MAEPCECGGRASAGSGSPEEEDDEEREPLLPRAAGAHPRRAAPGGAVRLQEAARGQDEAGDEEPLLACGDSRILDVDSDRSRSAISGASAPSGASRGPLSHA